MGGRFLSAPLLCSVIIISKFKIKSTRSLILQIASVVIIGLLSPRPTVISTPDYGVGARILKNLKFRPYMARTYHGIVDERIHYSASTGLLNNIIESQIFKFNIIDSALLASNLNDRVVVNRIIGVFGYYVGPRVHIIDPLALSDPLLSKLPCRWALPFDDSRVHDPTRWRIGHFEREIPDGYIETIRTGTNQITDPNLSKYYDVLSKLIKGDIWDIDRFKKIWEFNTGKYDCLLRNYVKNRKENSVY